MLRESHETANRAVHRQSSSEAMHVCAGSISLAVAVGQQAAV
jgi:hypothetical protein